MRDGAGAELSRDTEALERDGFGRVIAATRDGAPFATYAYDVKGLPLWASFDGAYGHGETVTLTHDPLTERRVGMNQHNAAWSAAVSQRMNSRGLVESESISIGAFATTRTYGYAPQGFLSQSDDASGSSYAYDYDAAGLPARISSTVNGAFEDRTLSRAGNVLSAGAHQHVFDDLGRVVRRDDVDLTYGPNGQIASARRADREWAYVYDEDEQHIAKLVGGVPVAAYLDDGAYLDGNARTVPVKLDGSVVGLLREVNGSPKTFALTVTDARGSVLAEEDGTPRLGSPYGDRAEHPDVAAAIDYATKGWDADLGAVRMGVRDYDPALNRWLTADPLYLEDPARCAKNPVSCSLYTYARNNPVLMLDPSGLEEQANPLLVVAGAVAVVLGFGLSAPSDTSAAPADLLGMVASVPGVGPAAGGAAKALVGGIIRKFLPSLGKALEEVAAAKTAADAARTANAGDAAVAAGAAKIDPGKFGYLFGEAGGNAHNVARTAQNAGQMARIGVYNNAEGRALLQSHFEGVVADSSNITRTFSNQYGNFQARESWFAGPGGFVKFESTWQVLPEGGYRFTTAIPFGGP